SLKELGGKDWSYSYFTDTDELYFSPPQIPKNTFLHSISNEFSVYLDKDSNVHGLFIEYFKTNFLEHEAEFAGLSKLLTSKNEGMATLHKSINKSGENQVKLVTSALTGEVISEIVPAITNLPKVIPV